MLVIIFLTALFLPYPIWIIEQFLPYPFIIEEIAKGFILALLLRENLSRKNFILSAIAIGALFAYSESLFYLLNLNLVGGAKLYFTRLAITIPLHAATCIIMIFPGLNEQKLKVQGIIMAMVLHFIFNLAVVKI